MFDAGSGRGAGDVLDRVVAGGVEPQTIRHLFLTHGHADHAGGAAHWRERLGLSVYAAPATAAMVETGDERRISLDRARRAGGYPEDYRFRACPVDKTLEPDGSVRIGSLLVRCIPTPGHSHDHVSYLIEAPDRRLLVSGDALFYDGKVAIQDIEDCSISEVCSTVRRIAQLQFDALLPGHLGFTLRGGKRHAEKALSYVNEMHCPPSII